MSIIEPVHAAEHENKSRPTIVMVHGAFVESASWEGVTARLLDQGYQVVAVANPLRGLENDATYVRDIIKAVGGTTVLVGHSYGGAVISNAAYDNRQVKALVYVSAFAPDAGESVSDLLNQFSGYTLDTVLAAAVVQSGGGRDLYMSASQFRRRLAEDIPVARAEQMAASQRPISESALRDHAGPPAWKQKPSWFLFGSRDKHVPPAALQFMADRARSQRTQSVHGASHLVMVSRPELVANMIVEAALSK
ncbi:alpha/beta fold hydrolase [Variovorax paradoxus]|uniref:alpha/beta fold hydrolase n=2 Tax=Variovorax TaxID=34072 RepID=UPI0038D15B4F